MKKLYLAVFIVAGCLFLDTKPMNWNAAAGNFPTSGDLDAIKVAIRHRLTAISTLIANNYVPQAIAALNDPQLVQAIRNNPSFAAQYNSLKNRVIPNVNNQFQGTPRRLQFNDINPD